MQANEPSSRLGSTGQGSTGQPGRGGRASGGGGLAALVYGGASFVASLVFFLVTTFAGSYPAVARWGGAVWVFILVMIVLMPIVIPRSTSWRRGVSKEERCAL